MTNAMRGEQSGLLNEPETGSAVRESHRNRVQRTAPNLSKRFDFRSNVGTRRLVPFSPCRLSLSLPLLNFIPFRRRKPEVRVYAYAISKLLRTIITAICLIDLLLTRINKCGCNRKI